MRACIHVCMHDACMIMVHGAIGDRYQVWFWAFTAHSDMMLTTNSLVSRMLAQVSLTLLGPTKIRSRRDHICLGGAHKHAGHETSQTRGESRHEEKHRTCRRVCGSMTPQESEGRAPRSRSSCRVPHYQHQQLSARTPAR